MDHELASNPTLLDFRKSSLNFTDIGDSESMDLRKVSLRTLGQGFDSMRRITTRKNLEEVLEVPAELTERGSKERFGDSPVESRSRDTPDWEHSIEKECEHTNTLEKMT